MVRRTVPSVLAAALVAAAFAAPAAQAQAPRLVANVAPWAPIVSPSGNIAQQRLDCVAADPAAVRVEVNCTTTHGAQASASGAQAATANEIDAVGGGVNLAFTSFTFCADATFHYADGSTDTAEGCVIDDFGTATVLGA
jgi:hypothetical protein